MMSMPTSQKVIFPPSPESPPALKGSETPDSFSFPNSDTSVSTPRPPASLNIRLLSHVFLSCFGACYFGYTAAVIGGCVELPSFISSFSLEPPGTPSYNYIASNVISSIYFGSVIGSMAVIPLANKFGPRVGLAGSAGTYMAGSALQIWSGGSVWAMYIGRALAGVGMGGSTSLAPMYISEISPALVRGFLVGIHELVWHVANLFGFWVNYGVSRHFNPKDPNQWKTPLGIQLIPATILFLSAIFILHESPRYLVRRNKTQEAEKVFSFLRRVPVDHPIIRGEMLEIQADFEENQRAQAETSSSVVERILDPKDKIWKRLLMGIAMMFFLNLTGALAITSYSPAIFRMLGFQGRDKLLMLTGIYGMVKSATSAVSSIFLVDRWGRKRLLILMGVGCSVTMW